MLWSAPLVFWVFGGQNTRYWELIEESFSNSKWTETFTFEHLSVVIRGVFGGSCGFTWYCATCLHPHSINQNFWNKLPWYYDTVRIHPQFTQPINPHSINQNFEISYHDTMILYESTYNSPNQSTHTQLTYYLYSDFHHGTVQVHPHSINSNFWNPTIAAFHFDLDFHHHDIASQTVLPIWALPKTFCW